MNLVGETYNELGGSHYYSTYDRIGNSVPKVDPVKGKKLMDALSEATGKGLVRACHDLSEGGLGVAAAEMAFAGGLGIELHLDKVPLGEPMKRDDLILFSESNTRFLVEVPLSHAAKFEETLAGVSCTAIGRVTSGSRLEVYDLNGGLALSADIEELKEAWQEPLRW
jgi:phosphoribosylformylglycinamidine (FGAM) synthase-like enzyme